MKRAIILATTIILMLTLCLPASAGTVTHVDGPYTFHMTGGDSALVAVDPSLSGDVTIPLEAKNYALNRITEDAYKDCVNITSIDIGDHVTSIFGTAFRGCTGLKTVYFNASRMTKMGDKDNFAFTGCTSLSKIVIGSSVTSIPEYAFAGIASLKTIEWGGTNEIGKGAFMGAGFEELVIPEGITKIGADAFKNCVNLKSVTIPASVTEIDASAFEGCTSLKTVVYNAESAKIGNGAFKTIETLLVGDNVKAISDNAFKGCTSLSALNLGKVEKIGVRAFEGCTALKAVAIPDSVKTLGHSAFKGCSALSSVKIGSGIKTISNDSFAGCAIKNLKLPATVTRVARGAFKDCKVETLTCSFIGEASGSSNSFIGHIFGATSVAENKTFVPATLKTVTVSGDVAENAFLGCESIKVNGGSTPTESEPTEDTPSEIEPEEDNSQVSTPTTPSGEKDGPNYILIAIILIAVVVVIGAIAVILLIKKK